MNALATRPPSHPSIARRTRPVGRAPASPMVLEGLLELLTQLNDKVTALERRPPQQIIAQPMGISASEAYPVSSMARQIRSMSVPREETCLASPMPTQSRPIEHVEPLPTRAQPRRVKVRRAKVRAFFD